MLRCVQPSGTRDCGHDSTCSDKVWPKAQPKDKTKGKDVPVPGEKEGILDEWGFLKNMKVACSGIVSAAKQPDKNREMMRTALQGNPMVLKDCQQLTLQLLLCHVPPVGKVMHLIT